MAWTTIPFGEWAPDQFPQGNAAAVIITNVLPRTATTYGPVPSATVYSGALAARVIGSYSIQDTSKNTYSFAGTRTKLYLLTAGSTNYADVSGATYTGGFWPDTQWSMTAYGLRVVACNFNDPTQTYLVPEDTTFRALAPTVTTTGDTHSNTTLDNLATTENVRAGMGVSGGSIPGGTLVASVISSTEVELTQAASATAAGVTVTFTSSVPRAKFCEVVGDFMMFANTFDGTSGAQPQRVWWSGIGDPENFPLPGSVQAIQVQSDYQDLVQTDLGQIMGLAAGPLPAASVTIFCERGVYTGLYGGSAIFSFKAIDGAPGCIAPHSIVKGHINSGGTIVPVIYYLSADGFCAFNGSAAIPLGANRFDRAVAGEMNRFLKQTTLGSYDAVNKMIVWAYSTSSVSTTYDRLLIYNWDVNRASLVSLTSSEVEWITRAGTIGFTLEELDEFGNVDTLAYSLDSEVWAGSDPRFAAFDSSHRLAFFIGANMAPTVETPTVEPFPGKRAFIRNARPLVDGTGGSVAVAVREFQAGATTLKTAVAMNAMGECPQRQTGRYVKLRFTLPASSSFTHLSGVEVDAIPQGIR